MKLIAFLCLIGATHVSAAAIHTVSGSILSDGVITMMGTLGDELAVGEKLTIKCDQAIFLRSVAAHLDRLTSMTGGNAANTAATAAAAITMVFPAGLFDTNANQGIYSCT